MTTRHKPTTVAERYDLGLRCARDKQLPPAALHPQPTRCWSAENIHLLECYEAWLTSGGLSRYVIDHLYLPTAGHVLGLNLKPYPQLDLERDLQRAFDYIQAKHLSAEWTDMCRNALHKFRSFLRQQRGAAELPRAAPDLTQYRAGLPEWLFTALEQYQQVRQSHWRPARVHDQTRRFWSSHTGLWRWILEHDALPDLTALKRRHIMAYVEARLAEGYAVNSINHDLRCFHGLLLFLQEHEQPIPPSLLRIPSLQPPDALPKFLTDEQVQKLRDGFERRVIEARTPVQTRDARLDRAAFYLLWQAGLRLGEVEELRLEDMDLKARQLTVRQGKGQKDRTVYLTDTLLRALQGYLNVRGQGADSHVFLYRHQPVKNDLLRSRMKLAGKRVGVKVHPHRLRHTCATQLLNAGCRITSIQKFLGHRRLNSTMIYARVHDRTVAEDYYAAMASVEQRLQLVPARESPAERSEEVHSELMTVVEKLAQPEVSDEVRLDLIEQMRQVLIEEFIKQNIPARS